MSVSFDTLAAKKILEDGGIETRQAESVVAAMGLAFGDGVATKADIDRLEASTDAKLAALETRMMKLYLGGVIFTVGAVLAGVRFLLI